ncbi:MAG TPA: carbohydrate ABC transporter permease, partial [Vitreimonas sp.]|nr:carbohydrate ABC transporter permease [Vitreimonas sp.]
MTAQPHQVGGPATAPLPAAGAQVAGRGANRRWPDLGPGTIVRFLALGVATVIFVFPFVWLLSASLKTRQTVLNSQLFPQPLQFENYVRVFEIAPVASWFTNSVLVGVLAAVTVTFSSALVAFAFAYFRFPRRNLLFGLVLATMMLPGAVVMIPSYLIWDTLGWTNTLVPLWAGNLFGSAFYIFLLRQFFLSLPRDLFEAARVDGASYPRMWWSVALPLTRSAMIVVFIFELKASWTDLLKPLIFIRDTALYTLPLGLQSLVSRFNPTSGGQGEFHYIMAASVIITVPM